MPSRPFLDPAAFPALARIRASWRDIRDEALRLRDASRIRGSDAYDDAGFNSFFRRGWKRFYLEWYGEPQPSALAHCPRTVALLESIPEIRAALFALLPAGGTLMEHRDPLAGSLRYLFCDVERPLRGRLPRAANRWLGDHLMRASRSRNEASERVGAVNVAFGRVYELRVLGKRLKAWNRPAYYAAKFALLAGLVWRVFL